MNTDPEEHELTFLKYWFFNYRWYFPYLSCLKSTFQLDFWMDFVLRSDSSAIVWLIWTKFLLKTLDLLSPLQMFASFICKELSGIYASISKNLVSTNYSEYWFFSFSKNVNISCLNSMILLKAFSLDSFYPIYFLHVHIQDVSFGITSFAARTSLWIIQGVHLVSQADFLIRSRTLV